jgi:hypothetical protein
VDAIMTEAAIPEISRNFIRASVSQPMSCLGNRGQVQRA